MHREIPVGWTYNSQTLTVYRVMQDLQRILTRSLDLLYSGTTNSSGLQVDCDFLLVIKTMETQLLAWHHEWLNLRHISGEFVVSPLSVYNGA